jgi:inosine/xanthosine triphosphatase
MTHIRIAVGTTNPCKVDAVKIAFESTFDLPITIDAYNVESGVSDQPFGDEETRIGAYNRARAALKESISACKRADFSVGLEGGVHVGKHPIDGSQELWCMAYMCILGSNSELCLSSKDPISTYDSNGEVKELCGEAKSASFKLPSSIVKLVLEENMELGHADDAVFQRVNSKHGQGTVGMLTSGKITRALYYDHALKQALIPFLWPEHYIE